jgi:hypothetical protein
LSALPHSEQNLAAAGALVPHLAQVTVACAAAGAAGAGVWGAAWGCWGWSVGWSAWLIIEPRL